MPSPANPTSPLMRSSPETGRIRPLVEIDPRSRILVVAAFALLVAVVERPLTLVVAVAIVACMAPMAGVSIRRGLRHMAPLNLFMLMLVVVLPWTTGSTPLVSLGPIAYSREGLLAATLITLKANATVGLLVVLLGSLDIVTLGHALSHLHMPRKLTHLLLFTVRYLGVLGDEYARLRVAMKMRAFRPGVSRHSYRTFGHMMGMLLVRSLDRSERIIDAMKCRAFRGHFYLFDHFAYSPRDLWFGLAMSGLFVLLALLEWS